MAPGNDGGGGDPHGGSGGWSGDPAQNPNAAGYPAANPDPSGQYQPDFGTSQYPPSGEGSYIDPYNSDAFGNPSGTYPAGSDPYGYDPLSADPYAGNPYGGSGQYGSYQTGNYGTGGGRGPGGPGSGPPAPPGGQPPPNNTTKIIAVAMAAVVVVAAGIIFLLINGSKDKKDDASSSGSRGRTMSRGTDISGRSQQPNSDDPTDTDPQTDEPTDPQTDPETGGPTTSDPDTPSNGGAHTFCRADESGNVAAFDVTLVLGMTEKGAAPTGFAKRTFEDCVAPNLRSKISALFGKRFDLATDDLTGANGRGPVAHYRIKALDGSGTLDLTMTKQSDSRYVATAFSFG